MKKAITFVLAIALCFSLIPASFASEDSVNPPPTSSVWDGPSLDPGIEPYADSVYWYQNDTIWNGKSTNTFSFRLDEDFQYAKIWIQNNSGDPITLCNSYNGKDLENPITIPAKSNRPGENEKTIFVAGNGNTGDFYCNIHTQNGKTLDGLISIKTGTKTGVDYPW